MCVYSASSSPENESFVMEKRRECGRFGSSAAGADLRQGRGGSQGTAYSGGNKWVRDHYRCAIEEYYATRNCERHTESLTEIAHYDVDIGSKQFQLVQLFYPFWLKFVDKMLSVDSVVVKLMAWDQLNSLIVAAHISKPRAAQYLVTGMELLA